MDKKITRRVVLGTAIGGLTAANAYLFFFRSVGVKPIYFDELGLYGEPHLAPGDVTSDLSPREVEKALGVLKTERDMWLTVRGVEGRINIVRETTYADQRAALRLEEAGHVSLSFDLQPSTDGRLYLPSDVKLTYGANKESKPVWEFTLGRRDGEGPGDFSGSEISSISHAELFTFLTLPLAVLSLTNNVVKEVREQMRVTRNRKAGAQPDSYMFESTGKPIADGLLPTFGFTNGHFSEFIPKRREGEPAPTLSLTNPTVVNGVAFPTVISMSSEDAKLGGAETTNVTVTLSDLHVATK
jgi:hypothetical protein